ncbi:3-hydroxyisobutyrate dehydrogenase-related conserved site [Neofusicoccum parvum]|nr:3-hydroxyisobutyrate dehydrogenase-related conserved site [Neofusicoccum parvum]
MARNQLARLPKDDTLIINDANTEAPTQVQELSPLGKPSRLRRAAPSKPAQKTIITAPQARRVCSAMLEPPTLPARASGRSVFVDGCMLANNYLLAVANVAATEAVQLGRGAEGAGWPDQRCYGRCWGSEVNDPVSGAVEGSPAGRGYQGGFAVGLMKKDMDLAMEGAREFGIDVTLGKVAAELYDVVAEHPGCRGRDFSVV